MTPPHTETCKTCDGKRTVRVLGTGGDYEDWPCPDCREKEYRKDIALIYGAADGDAE